MAVALATNALTTKELIKGDLGIATAVTTYDDIICGLINAASALIESRAGRKFHYESVTSEKLPGLGADTLSVARYPIDTSKIVTITYDGDTVDSTSYEIDGDGSSGIIRSLYGAFEWTAGGAGNICQDPLPGTERKLYAVSYYGGYVLPNDTGTRTLPADLELACRLIVAQLYRGLGRDPTVTSERLLSGSASYATGPGSEFPALAAAIIDSYRRFV